MSETEALTLDAARALISAALTANGVPDGAAHSVATALVAAEAEGQVGHGFSRLEDYVAQVRTGKIVASAEPVVTETSTTGLLIDAGHGFAFPALDVAVARGVEVAAAHGTATMAITRSHHCGALSVQVDRIARHGLVGIMMANTPSAIAPWGSGTPIFGTNPIAFSAPRAGRDPLVIDLSLSRVARGKVMHAKKSGQPIPEGWALDRGGNPTTDAEAALAGSMVPIGSAKGTALALMVEIFASVMTAANPSHEASGFFAADGPPPGVGQYLMTIQPGVGFGDRLEALLNVIEALDGTRLPGARRAEAIAKAQANGIAVPTAYIAAARRLADGPAE